MHSRFDIVVMGLGYIGLPTASILAVNGNRVHGVDTNKAVVQTINKGHIHIVEPGLEAMVNGAVNSGKLKAGLSPIEADVFIIAVPTPFVHEEGCEDCKKPDISYVLAATRSIAPFLKPGNLVVLESTSPVGTTEKVFETICAERPDLKALSESGPAIHLAYCPERVLPGQILKELVTNDRIVGGNTPTAAEMARKVYKTFCGGEIFLTDTRTAEMSKLVENAFRDVNIAFANELSLICDRMGINVWELIKLANRHPRVNILQPGPGVGGHCIAVDPWFIVDAAPDMARMVKTAREVNDGKPRWVLAKVKEAAAKLQNPVIACLGLAFKPNIDDLRESPALEITRELISMNIGEVLACEPNVDAFAQFPLHTLDEALARANLVVLLVDHDEFKAVEAERLKGKVVIDTRGIWRL